MTSLARILRDEATFVAADEAMPKVLDYAATHAPWPAPSSVTVIDGVGVVVFGKTPATRPSVAREAELRAESLGIAASAGMCRRDARRSHGGSRRPRSPPRFRPNTAAGLDLIVDLGDVLADDSQADHDEAAHDQQGDDRRGKAGDRAALEP